MENNKERAYQTLIVITLGFSLFSFILKIEELLYIGLFLSLLGIVSSLIALKIDLLWYKLAELMGKIMTPLILSSIYFIVLLPFALISKSKTKRNLKIDKCKSSTYNKIDKVYTKEDLENLW